METTARYTEAKIKTYGFETKVGLCNCQLRIAADRFSQMNPLDSDTTGNHIPFELVSMEAVDKHHYLLSIVVTNDHEQTTRQYIKSLQPWYRHKHIDVIAPVELLYFFGPHYGDRFGIADRAYCALQQHNIPLFASACSSSSIFLVLPEHGAAAAKAVFSELFDIPQTVQRPSFFTDKRHNAQRGG
jgi:aspartokinase